MSVKRIVPGLAAVLMGMLPVCAFAADTGMASWYGGRHDGRRTSSGEVFDQEAMTAASSRLPLGSVVRVTMHETGSSVVVRVTDRMGARASIIDLSQGAARQIGLLGRGRGMVTVAPASEEPLEVAEASEDETGDVSATPGRRIGRRAAGHHTRIHGATPISTHHAAPARPLRRRA